VVDEVEPLAAGVLLVPEPEPPLLSERMVVSDRLLMLGSERFVVDEVERSATGALLVPEPPLLSERMVVSDRLLMLGSPLLLGLPRLALASSALPPTTAPPTPPTTAPTGPPTIAPPTAPPTAPAVAPSSAFAAKGIASAATTAPAINMLFFIMRSSE